MTRPYIMKKGVSSILDLVDGSLFFPFFTGNHYWLDPTNGSDAKDGKTPDTAVATLAYAYSLLTADQNDVLFYIPGTSSITLSAALTWAKSYTHFIGLSAPTKVAQRARIFQLATLTGASPLLTISASGCVFSNFYIFQGVDDATSLINVSVTGNRNHFYNVHFAGGGHATQAINGGISLQINGGSENTFERCTIGVDTIAAATGMCGLSFPSTGGATRNRFYNCDFTMWAGNAGAIFIELLGNSGIDRYQIFEDCQFINLASTAMSEAFNVAAGFDPANKRVLMKDCRKIGATKWDANDRGIIYGDMVAVTGADTSGELKEMIT